ncbi:MAG: HAMP domain-containing histidine kinase [Thermoanaerobaculaceae bacterium]|jgi:signal transduction histidine kinase|nr:HAMP domain-containing histidine kinase [Thermoanaerobaculaceae bacterium]
MDDRTPADLDRTTLSRREVRKALRRALGHRRTLWLWLLAALLPLAVLLVLQFLWLSDLQRSSSIARRAIYSKVLDIFTKEATSRYYRAAQRALDVSPVLLPEAARPFLAQHFRALGSELARTQFVVTFGTEKNLLVFDPGSSSMISPPPSHDTMAIWVAVAPWSLMAAKGEKLEKAQLVVEERDRSCRLMLRPITDCSSHVIGVAGLVIDEQRFRKEILPQAVRTVLESVDVMASVNKTGSLTISVCDGTGAPVLEEGPGCGVKKALAKRSLSFIFTDWMVLLEDSGESPEAWAQRNFTFNLATSTALAAVLLVAVVLALRAAAREVRLGEMKSDFVSNVSHELRTPLASIRVFGELMRSGRVATPDKVREYGEHIENESRRLCQLVENILDFSRIESGRKVYTFAEADLAEVVRGAVASFGVRTQQAGFTIDLDVPASPGLPARVDAGAVDHAICNLLDNALKYSGSARRAAVRLRRDGGEAVIEVEDHGIGIPRSEQGRIFDRFYRVGTGAVHEVRGVGLGLAIVRHIVAAHGGTVAVESEPGKGSVFSIRLPLGPPVGEAQTP